MHRRDQSDSAAPLHTTAVWDPSLRLNPEDIGGDILRQYHGGLSLVNPLVLFVPAIHKTSPSSVFSFKKDDALSQRWQALVEFLLINNHRMRDGVAATTKKPQSLLCVQRISITINGIKKAGDLYFLYQETGDSHMRVSVEAKLKAGLPKNTPEAEMQLAIEHVMSLLDPSGDYSSWIVDEYTDTTPDEKKSPDPSPVPPETARQSSDNSSQSDRDPTSSPTTSAVSELAVATSRMLVIQENTEDIGERSSVSSSVSQKRRREEPESDSDEDEEGEEDDDEEGEDEEEEEEEDEESDEEKEGNTKKKKKKKQGTAPKEKKRKQERPRKPLAYKEACLLAKKMKKQAMNGYFHDYNSFLHQIVSTTEHSMIHAFKTEKPLVKKIFVDQSDMNIWDVLIKHMSTATSYFTTAAQYVIACGHMDNATQIPLRLNQQDLDPYHKDTAFLAEHNPSASALPSAIFSLSNAIACMKWYFIETERVDVLTLSMQEQEKLRALFDPSQYTSEVVAPVLYSTLMCARTGSRPSIGHSVTGPFIAEYPTFVISGTMSNPKKMAMMDDPEFVMQPDCTDSVISTIEAKLASSSVDAEQRLRILSAVSHGPTVLISQKPNDVRSAVSKHMQKAWSNFKTLCDAGDKAAADTAMRVAIKWAVQRLEMGMIRKADLWGRTQCAFGRWHALCVDGDPMSVPKAPGIGCVVSKVTEATKLIKEITSPGMRSGFSMRFDKPSATTTPFHSVLDKLCMMLDLMDVDWKHATCAQQWAAVLDSQRWFEGLDKELTPHGIVFFLQGKSSQGKNFAIDMMAKFLPPGVMDRPTHATALADTDNRDHVGRIIFLDEAPKQVLGLERMSSGNAKQRARHIINPSPASDDANSSTIKSAMTSRVVETSTLTVQDGGNRATNVSQSVKFGYWSLAANVIKGELSLDFQTRLFSCLLVEDRAISTERKDCISVEPDAVPITKQRAQLCHIQYLTWAALWMINTEIIRPPVNTSAFAVADAIFREFNLSHISLFSSPTGKDVVTRYINAIKTLCIGPTVANAVVSTFAMGVNAPDPKRQWDLAHLKQIEPLLIVPPFIAAQAIELHDGFAISVAVEIATTLREKLLGIGISKALAIKRAVCPPISTDNETQDSYTTVADSEISDSKWFAPLPPPIVCVSTTVPSCTLMLRKILLRDGKGSIPIVSANRQSNRNAPSSSRGEDRAPGFQTYTEGVTLPNPFADRPRQQGAAEDESEYEMPELVSQEDIKNFISSLHSYIKYPRGGCTYGRTGVAVNQPYFIVDNFFPDGPFMSLPDKLTYIATEIVKNQTLYSFMEAQILEMVVKLADPCIASHLDEKGDVVYRPAILIQGGATRSLGIHAKFAAVHDLSLVDSIVRILHYVVNPTRPFTHYHSAQLQKTGPTQMKRFRIIETCVKTFRDHTPPQDQAVSSNQRSPDQPNYLDICVEMDKKMKTYNNDRIEASAFAQTAQHDEKFKFCMNSIKKYRWNWQVVHNILEICAILDRMHTEAKLSGETNPVLQQIQMAVQSFMTMFNAAWLWIGMVTRANPIPRDTHACEARRFDNIQSSVNTHLKPAQITLAKKAFEKLDKSRDMAMVETTPLWTDAFTGMAPAIQTLATQVQTPRPMRRPMGMGDITDQLAEGKNSMGNKDFTMDETADYIESHGVEFKRTAGKKQAIVKIDHKLVVNDVKAHAARIFGKDAKVPTYMAFEGLNNIHSHYAEYQRVASAVRAAAKQGNVTDALLLEFTTALKNDVQARANRGALGPDAMTVANSSGKTGYWLSVGHTEARMRDIGMTDKLTIEHVVQQFAAHGKSTDERLANARFIIKQYFAGGGGM